MIIGLDIDNVIADLDEAYLGYFLAEDKNKRNSGIVNPNARHITDGMLDWSEDEVESFLCDKMDEMGENLKVIGGAKHYIDKIRADGHKVFLLTHRKNIYWKDPENITKKWLRENQINYDKLIFTKTTDKSKECMEHKIDIVFDDSISNCQFLVRNGILCYLVKTRYNEKHNVGFRIVNNWEEIYETIKCHS